MFMFVATVVRVMLIRPHCHFQVWMVWWWITLRYIPHVVMSTDAAWSWWPQRHDSDQVEGTWASFTGIWCDSYSVEWLIADSWQLYFDGFSSSWCLLKQASSQLHTRLDCLHICTANTSTMASPGINNAQESPHHCLLAVQCRQGFKVWHCWPPSDKTETTEPPDIWTCIHNGHRR